MITGEVNFEGEAIISLEVRGKGRRRTTITAVVDTGFDGHLTLPEDLISKLSLPWSRFGTAELADLSVVGFDVFEGRVVWDGGLRTVPIDSSPGPPLIGMELMKNHRVTIEIVPGGLLQIEELSAQ